MKSEPILRELDKLSIWDLSHYWHGFNPQTSMPTCLPLEVQKTMRALAFKASKGLYLICKTKGFVFNRLTNPEDQITISVVKRTFKREFQYAIRGRKYKRSFLSEVYIGRKSVLIWCKKNKIDPPKFWFSDNDPLLFKTIEELDTSLPPDQMLKYGYVALFDITQANDNLNKDYQFSINIDIETDKPDFKKNNTIIEKALSEVNRANAKARYTELDKIKVNFYKYYSESKSKFKSKAAAATVFFEDLSFAEKVLVVPSYDDKDKSEGIKKAKRNLLKVIKK